MCSKLDIQIPNVKYDTEGKGHWNSLHHVDCSNHGLLLWLWGLLWQWKFVHGCLDVLTPNSPFISQLLSTFHWIKFTRAWKVRALHFSVIFWLVWPCLLPGIELHTFCQLYRFLIEVQRKPNWQDPCIPGFEERTLLARGHPAHIGPIKNNVKDTQKNDKTHTHAHTRYGWWVIYERFVVFDV